MRAAIAVGRSLSANTDPGRGRNEAVPGLNKVVVALITARGHTNSGALSILATARQNFELGV